MEERRLITGAAGTRTAREARRGCRLRPHSGPMTSLFHCPCFTRGETEAGLGCVPCLRSVINGRAGTRPRPPALGLVLVPGFISIVIIVRLLYLRVIT